MGTRKFLEGYTFDDVLIRPRASAVEPGSASVKTRLVRGFFISTPFISAAMDKVTDAHMAIAIWKSGGLGILHRNCSIEEQVKMVKKARVAGVEVGAACGPFDIERALALEASGARIISIDCAHGHNLKVIKSARAIKKSLRHAKLIFGNIATAEAAEAVCDFADAVKVGVGPGSICTTRLVSGVGMPQLSAIMEVAQIAKKYDCPVIADGGVRSSGDAAKAFAAGASSIMLGNILAGSVESPGKIILRDGLKYKEYRGMGSRAVIESTSGSERYLTKNRKPVAEGVEALVPLKNSVREILADLSSGVQVAMGYVGARTLPEFAKKAQFIRITSATLSENGPHSLAHVI